MEALALLIGNDARHCARRSGGEEERSREKGCDRRELLLLVLEGNRRWSSSGLAGGRGTTGK